MIIKNREWIVDKLMLTYAPMLGTVFMLYSYFPQLYMTYSTQNVSGQSLQFWVVLSVGLIAMTIQQYGMILKGNKKYMGLVFQLLNTLLALVQMFGVWYYG